MNNQEDALPALPEPYWPGFRPSLDSRVDLFTADQMHSYARAALAARDDAQGDQVADVAIALEQQRALKIVADVAALRSDKDMTEAFDAGFVTACDEIEHRLRTERWALGGVDGPLPAARDDARDADTDRLQFLAGSMTKESTRDQDEKCWWGIDADAYLAYEVEPTLEGLRAAIDSARGEA